MNKNEVVIYKQDLEGIILALEWILNKQNFECDCESHHEWDTNATIHSDNCALSMIDHTEAVLDNMRKYREANGRPSTSLY